MLITAAAHCKKDAIPLVKVDKRVEKQPEKIPAAVRRKLIQRLAELELNPRPSGVVKLTEQDHLYRIRYGSYRVIYQIQDALCLVLVIEVGHHSTVYRSLGTN